MNLSPQKALLFLATIIAALPSVHPQASYDPEAVKATEAFMIRYLDADFPLNEDALNNINNLAKGLNYVIRDFDRSINLLSRVATRPDPSNPRILAKFERSLYFLGLAYIQRGDARGVAQFERAQQILKSLGRNTSSQFANNSINLGVWYSESGRYKESIEHYHEALKIYEKLIERGDLPFGDSWHINLLSSLGGVYYNYGDYKSSLRFLSEARDLHDKYIGKPDAAYAGILNNLGSLYAGIGSFDKAVDLHLQTHNIFLGLYGENDPSTLRSLQNLIGAYGEAGRVSEVEEGYDELIELTRAYYGENHTNLAVVKTNYGSYLLENGSAKQALDPLIASMEIHDRAEDKDFPNMALNLYHIGRANFALGRESEAIDKYEEALLINNVAEIENPHVEAFIKFYAAQTYENMGSSDLAILLGKQSINFAQSVRSDIATQSKDLRKGFLSRVEPSLRYLSSLLIKSGRIPEGQTVLKMLKEEEYANFTGINRSDRSRISLTPSEETLNILYENYIDTLKIHLIDEDAPSSQPIFRRQRTRLLEQIEEWKRKNPLVEKNLQPKRDWSSTLGEGHAKSILYQAIVAEDNAQIVLSSESSRQVFEVPLPVSELNQLVYEFLSAIRDHTSNPKPIASRLYEALIKPAEGFINQAEANTLVFSLDKALRYIPYGALYNNQGQSYLIENYEIATLSEVADPGKFNENRKIRVFGFGTSEARSGFSALPNVALELDMIVKDSDEDAIGVFPGTVSINNDFNLTRIHDAAASNASIMHFASHFALKPGNMRDSFLLLGNGDQLSLSNLAKINLEKTDLVVLSACETGIGDFAIRKGSGAENEGMATLLQNRGAKGVIASQWPIADRGAAVFMGLFYQHLSQGTNYSKAMQLAQNDMLKGKAETRLDSLLTREKFGAFTKNRKPTSELSLRHPYFWAPFVYYHSASQ